MVHRQARRRHTASVVDVVIYSSKARGDWHEESDLDVLAMLTDETEKGEEKAINTLSYEFDTWSAVLPSVWTIRAAEWQKLAEEGSPWRRAIERDGFCITTSTFVGRNDSPWRRAIERDRFSVWKDTGPRSGGIRPAPVDESSGPAATTPQERG